MTIFSSRWATLYAHEVSHPLLPSLSIGIPGIQLSLPSLLGDIWDSVLRAVPKKKVSHSRRRHRQMAGKALEDVNSLCKCPGCGQTKRMHRLCPNCMNSMSQSPWVARIRVGHFANGTTEIRQIWREDNPSGKFS